MSVRTEMKELILKTKALLLKEREIALETVFLIGKIHEENIPVNFAYTSEDFAEKVLGITASQFWKRVSASKLYKRFPEFLELTKKGKLPISNATVISSKVTEANKEIILNEVPGKTKREVEEFIRRVGSDGFIREEEIRIEVKLSLTEKEYELFKRAKEVSMSCGKVPRYYGYPELGKNSRFI